MLLVSTSPPIIEHMEYPVEKRTVLRQQVFAHVPYRYLQTDPDLFLEKDLQPEIYFSSSDLKKMDRQEAKKLASGLRDAGLNCTFHAPFLDLNPGAVDPEVRLLSLSKYRAVLEVAALFSPKTIVFHPGYDQWRYDGQIDKWLKESVKTWNEVLNAAQRLSPDTKILVENIFETEPLSFVRLFSSIDHPQFGFCFDTGHFLIFSQRPLEEWIEKLGHVLVEIHIHDNNGQSDEHRPPGYGTFPFDLLFNNLDPEQLETIYLTVEAHCEKDLSLSLEYLDDRFGFYGK